jgi:hypothetical protein
MNNLPIIEILRMILRIFKPKRSKNEKKSDFEKTFEKIL